MKRAPIYALTALLLCSAAIAQPQAGGRQRQGGNRPGGMRIPGMRMLNRPLTLSQVPLPTLKAVFKLSSAQEQKVQGIQQKAMEEVRALMPRRQPGQPMDRNAFNKLMPKFEAISKKADAQILAVMTPEQKKKVPAMLKEMQVLRGTGLPMSLAGSLRLTADQIAKLDKIAKERSDATAKLFQGNQGGMAAMQQMSALREAARKKALAVLNAQQKAAVEKWEKEHPRRGFMGGPGMGGPAMGGPGAPGMGGGRPAGPGRPGGGMGGGRPRQGQGPRGGGR